MCIDLYPIRLQLRHKLLIIPFLYHHVLRLRRKHHLSTHLCRKEIHAVFMILYEVGLLQLDLPPWFIGFAIDPVHVLGFGTLCGKLLQVNGANGHYRVCVLLSFPVSAEVSAIIVSEDTKQLLMSIKVEKLLEQGESGLSFLVWCNAKISAQFRSNPIIRVTHLINDRGRHLGALHLVFNAGAELKPVLLARQLKLLRWLVPMEVPLHGAIKLKPRRVDLE